MKKNNMNTPKFWDEEFKKEYKTIIGESDNPYHRWMPDKFHALSQEIFDVKGKILDVGCGLGHLCRYLKAEFPLAEVVGTDFSDFAVKKAKEFGSKVFKSSCYELSIHRKNYYDYVIASDIIEHLNRPKKFLKEVREVLRPGGKLILTTPIKGKCMSSKDHIQEYEVKELYDLLNKYFESVEIKDFKTNQMGIAHKA